MTKADQGAEGHMPASMSEHDRVQHAAALEFLERIPLGTFESIADLGAGPGHQGKYFHDRGKRVTCIDFRVPQYPELEHIRADLVDIPVADGRFDALWSHHCLEHIHAPIHALAEWNRILRDNGWLFLTVPQIGMTISAGHINSYNIPLLIYHLAIAGFDCRAGFFTKSRSHLRAAVRKATAYRPTRERLEMSLAKLADYGLFHDATAAAIRATGRFSCDGMVLSWLDGRKIYARRNTQLVSEWMETAYWDYSRSSGAEKTTQ